jgi:hypothetical protein
MFVSLIYLFMCYLFNDAIALEVRGGAIGWGIWLQARVTGSIPDGVIEIFLWLDLSHCTVLLGSNQPLAETIVKGFSWVVKATGALEWQPYHLRVPIVYKFWEP